MKQLCLNSILVANNLLPAEFNKHPENMITKLELT